jgi:hypothetical protein
MPIYSIETATGEYSTWHDTDELPEGYEAVPERPSPYYNLVNGSWVFDTSAEINSKRATAKLSRTNFVLAAHAAGLLSDSDAELAARGEVPYVLTAAIANNTDLEKVQAKIIWGGLVEVNRNHPLIGIVQAHMGLTDTQVDALFGIT